MCRSTPRPMRRRAIFSAMTARSSPMLLVQSVGLAAYLVPAVLFGWAFRLMLARPIRRPGRGIVLLLLALVLGAAACSILHAGPALPAGAGGVVGWVLLGLVERAGLAHARPAAGDGGRRAGRIAAAVDHRAVARRLARSGQRRRPGRRLGSPAPRGAARRRPRRSASGCFGDGGRPGCARRDRRRPPDRHGRGPRPQPQPRAGPW